MAQEKFYADRSKWFLHNLKFALLNALGAVSFWLFFDNNGEETSLIFAVLFSIGALVFIFTGIFGRPKLFIGDGKLQFGKEGFEFSDVVNVLHPKKTEYTFLLASRRRVVVKTTHFKESDIKTIDRILAEESARHLTAPEAKEKIAGIADDSQFEFTVEAKRTTAFFGIYMFVSIMGGITLLFVFIMLAAGVFSDSGPAMTGTLITMCVTVFIWLLCFYIEKKRPKNVFSYKDQVFTLSRNGKIKTTFPKSDVQGVGVNPQGQAYIVFRVKGLKDKFRLQLIQFSRKDIKFLKQQVRSIFFLPDNSPSPVNNFKNPFKI